MTRKRFGPSSVHTKFQHSLHKKITRIAFLLAPAKTRTVFGNQLLNEICSGTRGIQLCQNFVIHIFPKFSQVIHSFSLFTDPFLYDAISFLQKRNRRSESYFRTAVFIMERCLSDFVFLDRELKTLWDIY